MELVWKRASVREREGRSARRKRAGAHPAPWPADAPSKESGDSKGSVESRVCICARFRIQLPSTTETLKRVEETGAHEADEAKQRDLGIWIVIDPLQPRVALVQRLLLAIVRCAVAQPTAIR